MNPTGRPAARMLSCSIVYRNNIKERYIVNTIFVVDSSIYNPKEVDYLREIVQISHKNLMHSKHTYHHSTQSGKELN